MTSANNEAQKNEAVKLAVEAFNSLVPVDRLGALALIYKEVASSIPANSIISPSSDVSGLLSKIQEIPQDRQVDALQDILTAKKEVTEEVVLNPNPAKALGELITGGGATVPTKEYTSLDAQSKLAFWYQVGQKFSSSIPSDFTPSSQVTDLLNSFKSLDDEQRINVLKRAV